MAQQNSTERALQVANSPLNRDIHGGELVVIEWNHVQVGAGAGAGDFIVLPKLPANARVHVALCDITFPTLTLATGDFGWLAYTNAKGDNVVADPDGLVADLSIAAAGNARWMDGTVAARSFLFDGANVLLTVQVNDATIADAAIYSGTIVCSIG